jgi:iron-sulfur cluster repair protein YtfE (RIC family)
MDAPDPLIALEHDHVHLSRLVAELRHMTAELLRQDARPEVSEEIAATLASLRDDLFEHFAREEEALFPYLAGALPDLGPTIARLEGAHDRICGGISRLHAIATTGDAGLRDHRALVAQLFARFDAEYVEHARQEGEFLRGLAQRLDDDRRQHVRRLMKEV